MNPVVKMTWVLNHPVGAAELTEQLGSTFDIEFESPTTAAMTVYDDFDADLWNADHFLCRVDARRFKLIDGSGLVGEVRARARARFWWEFPEGDVQDRLKGLIGLRAVLPVAAMELTGTRFALRNGDEKIIVKGRTLHAEASDSRRDYLELQEMRGYARDFKRAGKLLKPLARSRVADSGLKTIITEQQLKEDEPPPQPAVHLAPEMPAELAVRAMGASMLERATRNVDGVIADVDTVFLHQFRVSIRKLRSLVSLLKNAVPTTMGEALAPRLSSIAGRTGRLRDLDVFLLEKDNYRAMLPDGHDEGLNALYALVERQRRLERTRVARYFQSGGFEQEIDDCREWLLAEPAFETAMSEKAVLGVAKSLLIKRYRRIQSLGEQLGPDSPDEDVHDIRKQCKKFRYLIEFFDELLPPKHTRRILSRLKKIQLTLGQFNDYCVQIEFLDGFDDDARVEMSKSLSGLTAILHHKRIEARGQVDAALSRFSSEEVAGEVARAFGKKAGGASK